MKFSNLTKSSSLDLRMSITLIFLLAEMVTEKIEKANLQL